MAESFLDCILVSCHEIETSNLELIISDIIVKPISVHIFIWLFSKAI